MSKSRPEFLWIPVPEVFSFGQSKGTPMSIDIIDFEAFKLHATGGKYSHDGGRLPVEKVFHDAAADVEEGLEFWKTLAGSRVSVRRASREFLNRHG